MLGGTRLCTLTAVALKTRLDGGESITVLDVREDDERAFNAIPLPSTARDLHIPDGANLISSRLDRSRVRSDRTRSWSTAITGCAR